MVSRQPEEHHSFQRDNLSETRISRKAHISRVTEVVELGGKCYISVDMQQVCNNKSKNY